jgi:hypothetical protein
MHALLKKLLLKPGHRAHFSSLPKDLAGIADGLTGIEIAKSPTGKLDWVLVFCTTLAEAEKQVPKLARSLSDKGLLWIGYPKAKKLGTDLSRDVLRVELEKRAPVEAVAICSLDDTWSALRIKRTDV